MNNLCPVSLLGNLGKEGGGAGNVPPTHPHHSDYWRTHRTAAIGIYRKQLVLQYLTGNCQTPVSGTQNCHIIKTAEETQSSIVLEDQDGSKDRVIPSTTMKLGNCLIIHKYVSFIFKMDTDNDLSVTPR